MSWAQDRLGRFGYDVPHTGMVDAKTKSVILTFQMKYRASKFDGELDAETAALIDVATTPGGMVMAPQPGSAASAAPAAPAASAAPAAAAAPK